MKDTFQILELFGDRFLLYKQTLQKEMDSSKSFMEGNWGQFYVEPELVLREEGKEKERKFQNIAQILELGKEAKREFIVTGEPGIGKTTFLRYATKELCDKEGLLPVHIRLSDYSGDLENHIKNASAKLDVDIAGALKDNFVAEWKAGKTIFLFDALDETRSINQATAQIQTLRELYPNNYYFITVRTNQFLPGSWANFSRMEMERFSENKVKEYLNKRLGESEGESVYEKIKEFQLEDFSRLPLMLRFITEIKDKLGKIKNRSDLYQQFIEQRFSGREENEKLEEQRALIPPSYKIQVLSELALFMQTDKKTIDDFGGNKVEYYLAYTKLIDWAGKHKKLAKWKAIGEGESLTPPRLLTPQEIVAEIKSNGLIVKSFSGSAKTYRFLHKTVQEYLAACAIANRVEGRMGNIFDVSQIQKDTFSVPYNISIRDFIEKYVKYEDENFP